MITIYTIGGCDACVRTRAAFDRAGIEYRALDARDHVERLRADGYRTAPVVYVDAAPRVSWCGFRPDLIAEIVERLRAQ